MDSARRRCRRPKTLRVASLLRLARLAPHPAPSSTPPIRAASYYDDLADAFDVSDRELRMRTVHGLDDTRSALTSKD